MMVELQIDSEAFCKSFREQTRKALACELTEDAFDLNPADGVPGTPYIITGYTVGETTLRRAQNAANVCIHTGAANVTTFRQVHRPQIVQMVSPHIAWESDLRAANTATAPSVMLHLPVVFEASMETCGNMRVLCFHYVGLDGLVGDALTQKLAQKIKGACTWLPVEQILAEYMPKDVELVNSHCTLAQSGKCLVIRMEFWSEAWGADTGDASREVPEWEQFYTGHIQDRLTRGQERDGWSIFVDQHALTYFVRKTIADSVSGKSGLTITRQPVATWYPWYAFPALVTSRVHVNLEVEQKDACWCGPEDLDVTAEIDADVIIAVPAQDTLRIDIYLDVTPDFWDASCCVVMAATFWPVLGFGQYAQGKISAEDFALGLIPFLALIGAIVKVGEAGSDFKPPTGYVKDPDNDLHVYREQKLALPNNPSFGKMTLKGSQPLSDTTGLKASGLYLYGALDTFVAPQPELEDPELEPFCWGKGGRCSRRVVASTRFRLNPVNPGHWALLHVCNARVIDDPLGIFKVEVTREEHGLPDVIVTVDFWGMKADYWKPENRYPCRLLIKTSGGVRILTLPPLPSLTEEQFESLYLGIQLEFVNNCYLPRHRIFEELEWPIEVLIEQPGLHNWQVRVVGMTPGERVQLVDERGGVVARFTANRNGALQVNALGRLMEHAPSGRRRGFIGEAPSADTRSISTAHAPIFKLRRSMGGRTTLMSGPPLQTTMDYRSFEIDEALLAPLARASTVPICGPDGRGSPLEMIKIRATAFPDLVARHQDSSRHVVIRQTLLEEQGSIPLSGACLSLSVDAVKGSTRVVAIMPGLVETYDVSDARAPRRTGAWRAEGVRGAVAFGGRLMLWGDAGIWSVGQAPPATAAFARCEATGVRGAAAVRDRLFVLRAGELIVYGPGLCEQARYACKAEQIAAVGDSVALRDAEGLRFFDGRRGSLEEAAVYPLCSVTHIETPAISFGDAVYARVPTGSLVLTVSGGRLAEYEGGAWFEGVARAGRLLAFPAGRTVRLIQAVRSLQSE